jgi:hypothetical protein
LLLELLSLLIEYPLEIVAGHGVSAGGYHRIGAGGAERVRKLAAADPQDQERDDQQAHQGGRYGIFSGGTEGAGHFKCRAMPKTRAR